MKYLRKAKRLCVVCDDKPAENRRGGDDLCARCRRDIENAVMARLIALDAKVVELRPEGFLPEARTGEARLAPTREQGTR